VILTIAWLATAQPSPSALETRASVPGTCHLAEDPTELTATASDTSPAVPCTQPHQTETLWTGEVTGPLATQAERPNPELINAMLARNCDDYWRVRSYLGSDDHDVIWGVGLLLKVPTPAEWAAGERTFRCVGWGTASARARPPLTDTLRDVLRRRDSARFRLCRLGGVDVSCDQPHDREAMSPDVALADRSWPGNELPPAEALVECGGVAEAYLGAAPAGRSEVKVIADVPEKDRWDAGERYVSCWLGDTRAGATTGTLRGGLQ